MNTLFEKLDKLSSPLGSLFDAALDRLAPHTTASACGGKVLCGVICSGPCGSIGLPLKNHGYATSTANCNRGVYSALCPIGGCC